MLNALALKIIAGVGAILLLVILVQDRNHWKAKASSLTATIAADRAAVKAAQEQAKARNEAQVQKIEAQHESITNRVRSQYQRDLDRLRAQSKAAGGSPGRSGVSIVPKAAGGADGQELCVPSDRLLLAQELELKRNALIDWLERQLAVPVNPPSTAR